MVEYVKLKDEDDSPKRTQRKQRKFFSFKIFLLVFVGLFLLMSIISSITYSLSPKIAVVPITGTLTTQGETSLLSGRTTSSREIAQTLYNLRDDNSVKAVLLDINSGGGSPVASEEISQAINALKAEKPVYSLINDAGASGAFWIAVSTDKVYASSMSIVGSIGVTSVTLGLEDLIKEYNITYRKQTAGEFKDMGSPFREPLPEEEQIIQELLNTIHEQFISHIALERNMSYEEVEEYATGEIFLGSKALELNFIDEIGYYPEVINELKNMTTQNALVIDYGPQPSFFESLGTITIGTTPLTPSQGDVVLE